MPGTRPEALQTIAAAGAAAVVPGRLLSSTTPPVIARNAGPTAEFITPGKPVLGMVHLRRQG
jgi:phosphoribosylcarboxyaminoimidazole (NCAIR) mutase